MMGNYLRFLLSCLISFFLLASSASLISLARPNVAMAAADPNPQIYVEKPDRIEFGEWGNIGVEVTNSGGQSQGLTTAASFPGISDSANIVVTGSDLSEGSTAYPVGHSVSASYGTSTVNLSYPLRDGANWPWNGGEKHYISFKVKPEQWGTSTFYVKTVGKTADGSSHIYAPTSGTKDQQNEYVAVYTFSVSQPPGPDISGIDPDKLTAGVATQFTITGTNLKPSSGQPSVSINRGAWLNFF